jgi:hypothetical protein
MCRSVSGSQSAVSIPLVMPKRLPKRWRSTPSSPIPSFSSWISRAYVLLTVVTASEHTMPPFRNDTFPQYSS